MQFHNSILTLISFKSVKDKNKNLYVLDKTYVVVAKEN